MRRFFVETPIKGSRVVISGPEANHITKVNRLGHGDDIQLFDGTDRAFVAKITETGKNVVTADILEIHDDSRELGVDLVLAVALPKGDRQKVLVEKLVELGVSTLIPVNCERSVALSSPTSVDRLKRRVIEASKQCGRNQLMMIQQPVSYSDLVTTDFAAGTKLIAHPGTGAVSATIVTRDLSSTAGVTVLIGPEGGFTEGEVDAAIRVGWQQISLAPTILRIETAAAAAATIFGIARANLSE